MLKGVNKTVVEINNPENDYIEKAILFINPDKQASKEILINHNAKKYLNSLSTNDFKDKAAKNSKPFIQKAVLFTLNTALGILLTLFFLKIFG